MKSIFLIILTIISLQGCAQNNHMLNNDTVVEYTASTRGYFYKTTVTKNTITLTKDRSEIEIEKIDCKKEQWDNIISLINDIEVEKIETFNPPTTKRQVDAAAHTNIAIKINDAIYQSQTFDSGSPPVELEPLVKAILTLGKSVEKQ